MLQASLKGTGWSGTAVTQKKPATPTAGQRDAMILETAPHGRRSETPALDSYNHCDVLSRETFNVECWWWIETWLYPLGTDWIEVVWLFWFHVGPQAVKQFRMGNRNVFDWKLAWHTYFFFYKYSELLFHEYLSFLGVEPQDILPPNIFFYNLQNK